MIFALAGNPNCGKTTLFNQLTGANAHVGNFPGVTVEQKTATIRRHKNATVVDLPGIYSLSPYTSEEVVTRDYLLSGQADGIINIVDATNLERNLYLSLQLLELGIPTVIAFNMMDEVRTSGTSINIPDISRELGVPIVPISAYKNEGVAELIEAAVKTATARTAPMRNDFCKGAVHRSIHAAAHLIEDHAANKEICVRFAATKLIEGDCLMEKSLELSDNELATLRHIVTELETETDLDREAAMADMRYNFIEEVCSSCVIKKGESVEHNRSVKIDKLLTHKVLAIPVFLAVMASIFWLTFSVIGPFLSTGLEAVLNGITSFTQERLVGFGTNPLLISLIIDGIFNGISSVLSFLPTIIVLFLFLSLLEDSGYMARVAFIMDSLLRKIGLSGRSFVPMIIGFGCSVPAIMATRTLPSERDRKMTIFLTPFMSCTAKLPIYAFFTAAFFPNNAALVMIFLYVFGMVLAVLVGFLLKDTVFAGNPVPFVMELPSYRLPGIKSVVMLIWDKTKDFITRAFTIIFTVSIIIWVLTTFDIRFNVVENSSESILAMLGGFIAPLFAPLGFGDWRAATALISGFSMKEAVVSTFAVLSDSGAGVQSVLSEIFTPLSAFSFLVFTLIYTPCVAAIAAVKRELNSSSAALIVALSQTGLAWLVTFCVYNIGRLMGF